MKALLVNPWVYDFACYDLWAKPLGLLYIASILEKNGYECKLLDCMDRHHYKIKNSKNRKYGCGKYFAQEVEKPQILTHIPRKYKRYGLPIEIVEEEIYSFNPDIVLITSIMTYWYPGVFEIIKLIKKIYKKVPIILGGIYASLEYEHAKKYSGADFVFKGTNMIEFIKIIGGKWAPSSFKEYPIPAYHLYNELHYAPILTTIGCPYRCSYCAAYLLNQYEKRDPISVIKEIEYLYDKYKIKDFAFYDDALLYDEYHIKNILNGIKGLPINLHSPNGLYIKNITEDIAYLMKEAGFKTIRLSFASDKASKEDLINVINLFYKIGIDKNDIGVYLMIGLPDQSIKELIESIDFIKSLGVKIYFSEYSPIKGTKEWEKAKLPNDLDPLLTNNSILGVSMQKIKDLTKN